VEKFFHVKNFRCLFCDVLQRLYDVLMFCICGKALVGTVVNRMTHKDRIFMEFGIKIVSDAVM